MDYARKRVLFADVDETLCESTRPVSQEVAAELNRLIASGRRLAFVSGATAEQLLEQLGGALKGEYHLLATSGTRYLRVCGERREEIYSYRLPSDERSRVLLAIRMLALRHGIRSLTTEEDQIQDRGAQITFSALGREAPRERKRAFDPLRRLRSTWVEELRKDLGEDYHVSVAGTTSIDVTRAGLDRGWGISEFLRFHHRQAEEAVYFGGNLEPGGSGYPARVVVECVAVQGVQDMLARLKAIT